MFFKGGGNIATCFVLYLSKRFGIIVDTAAAAARAIVEAAVQGVVKDTSRGAVLV